MLCCLFDVVSERLRHQLSAAFMRFTQETEKSRGEDRRHERFFLWTEVGGYNLVGLGFIKYLYGQPLL